MWSYDLRTVDILLYASFTHKPLLKKNLHEISSEMKHKAIELGYGVLSK